MHVCRAAVLIRFDEGYDILATRIDVFEDNDDEDLQGGGAGSAAARTGEPWEGPVNGFPVPPQPSLPTEAEAEAEAARWIVLPPHEVASAAAAARDRRAEGGAGGIGGGAAVDVLADGVTVAASAHGGSGSSGGEQQLLVVPSRVVRGCHGDEAEALRRCAATSLWRKGCVGCSPRSCHPPIRP